jgi:hypothetical protein
MLANHCHCSHSIPYCCCLNVSGCEVSLRVSTWPVYSKTKLVFWPRASRSFVPNVPWHIRPDSVCARILQTKTIEIKSVRCIIIMLSFFSFSFFEVPFSKASICSCENDVRFLCNLRLSFKRAWYSSSFSFLFIDSSSRLDSLSESSQSSLS